MNERVLVVEDEPELAALVAEYIRAAGYRADIVGDGRAAVHAIRCEPPALVVLDLMLPRMDGIAVCRAVREFSDVPVIMLTARVEEIDRLLGLETGADDYICKPFSPREVVARIKAVLRRRTPMAVGAPRVQVDTAKRSIHIDGHALDLTPSEYALVSLLTGRPGVIFSRAQLLDAACSENLDASDRAVDSHIRNLRRKLHVALPGVDAIESVYGVGYRWREAL